MSASSRDSKDSAKKNESGPDYLGYYKHLVSELLSRDKDLLIPSLKIDSEGGDCSKGERIRNLGKGCEVDTYSSSLPFFNEGFGGVSEFKKERLKGILNQSAFCLDQEVDQILDNILAMFHIESELRDKELMSFFSSASDDDDTEALCSRKRKATSPISNKLGSNIENSHSESVRQVYRDIQDLQGNGKICSDAVEQYSVELCSKLGKMEQDLEEYLNIMVSKCRPMTRGEKQELGRKIRKLPEKALDRVVDLIKFRNLSAINLSDEISVNLEEQDNVTLWRLHYYVETVGKANNV